MISNFPDPLVFLRGPFLLPWLSYCLAMAVPGDTGFLKKKTGDTKGSLEKGSGQIDLKEKKGPKLQPPCAPWHLLLARLQKFHTTPSHKNNNANNGRAIAAGKNKPEASKTIRKRVEGRFMFCPPGRSRSAVLQDVQGQLLSLIPSESGRRHN
jgi:hypothetical protein